MTGCLNYDKFQREQRFRAHEITLAGPVRVRCLGRVSRSEEKEMGRIGIVAEIERYEFLRGDEFAA